MYKIVLDTETTGLDFKKHKLVEIGAIELNSRNRPTGLFFHAYINPKRKVSFEAEQVHGLTFDFLKNYPTFNQVKKDFLKFIEGKELIGHNLFFDLAFLNHELKFNLKNKTTDTLPLARKAFPGKRCSLDALCGYYHIDTSARYYHGALLDAKLLSDVYRNLIKKKQSPL